MTLSDLDRVIEGLELEAVFYKGPTVQEALTLLRRMRERAVEVTVGTSGLIQVPPRKWKMGYHPAYGRPALLLITPEDG